MPELGATPTNSRPGDWFSVIPSDQMSDIVELTATQNPEDLADLLDIARLGAATPEGLDRHDALIRAIVEHKSLFSSMLLGNILKEL